MGMLVSMAIKYWPVEEESKGKTLKEVFAEESEKAAVVARDPAPEPPKKKIQAPVLENLDVVFELSLDQPYAPEEVRKILEPFLQARFPGKVHVEDVFSEGSILSLRLGVATFLSEVAETLLGVAWVTDLVSRSGFSGK
jgi:hypothetical protein